MVLRLRSTHRRARARRLGELAGGRWRGDARLTCASLTLMAGTSVSTATRGSMSTGLASRTRTCMDMGCSTNQRSGTAAAATASDSAVDAAGSLAGAGSVVAPPNTAAIARMSSASERVSGCTYTPSRVTLTSCVRGA